MRLMWRGGTESDGVKHNLAAVVVAFSDEEISYPLQKWRSKCH